MILIDTKMKLYIGAYSTSMLWTVLISYSAVLLLSDGSLQTNAFLMPYVDKRVLTNSLPRHIASDAEIPDSKKPADEIRGQLFSRMWKMGRISVENGNQSKDRKSQPCNKSKPRLDYFSYLHSP